MATTHRETVGLACALACLGGVLLHASAHAQDRTHSLTPVLGVKLEHTDNVDSVSDESGQLQRAENIFTLTPALLFAHRGPNNTLDGRLGVLVEQRLQGTGSDRVLPDGLLRWRSELPEKGLGLEASLQAKQVKPVLSSVGSTANSTNATATETRAGLSPFFERNLSERNSLLAAVSGSLQRTDPRDDLQRSTRTRTTGAQLAWLTRPKPFGYSLETSALDEDVRNDTPTQASATPAISERGQTRQQTLRAALLYAWQEELELGLIAGVEQDKRVLTSQSNGLRLNAERQFDGPFGGVMATWRPTPRTTLTGRYESREAARNWNAEFTHRMRRTSFALVGSQSTTRNAPSLLTDRVTAPPTAGTPLPPEILTGAAPSLALDASASAALSIQRDVAVRVTYEGVRSTLRLASGRFQSRAMLSTNTSLPGTERSRYNAGTISYRLTPEISPTAGLRWSRAQDASGLSRREWQANLGMSTRLSPQTSLEAWLGVLRSTATSATKPNGERTSVNAVNVSLEHRF